MPVWHMHVCRVFFTLKKLYLRQDSLKQRHLCTCQVMGKSWGHQSLYYSKAPQGEVNHMQKSTRDENASRMCAKSSMHEAGLRLHAAQHTTSRQFTFQFSWPVC